MWKAKTKTEPQMCRTCALKSKGTPIGNYNMIKISDVVKDLVKEQKIKSSKSRSHINNKSDKQKKIDAAYRVLNIAYLQKNKVCMAQFEGICQGRATELHHTYFGSNKRKHYLNEYTFKALCVACHWHLHNKMDSDELVKLGLRILDQKIMAITSTYEYMKTQFNPKYWGSIEEFEEYFLRRHSETSSDMNYYTNKEGIEVKIPRTDHYPNLQEYEVWMEGYAATGESSGATLIGKCMARNFAQACHYIMCKWKLDTIEKENSVGNTQYVNSDRWDYNPRELSLWACKLYWSEELARKSFG